MDPFFLNCAKFPWKTTGSTMDDLLHTACKAQVVWCAEWQWKPTLYSVCSWHICDQGSKFTCLVLTGQNFNSKIFTPCLDLSFENHSGTDGYQNLKKKIIWKFKFSKIRNIGSWGYKPQSGKKKNLLFYDKENKVGTWKIIYIANKYNILKPLFQLKREKIKEKGIKDKKMNADKHDTSGFSF